MTFEEAKKCLTAGNTGVLYEDFSRLNQGTYAHRRSWNHPTKSIFDTQNFMTDWLKVDNWKKPLGLVLCGVTPGKYDKWSPSEDDLNADDWEVAFINRTESKDIEHDFIISGDFRTIVNK